MSRWAVSCLSVDPISVSLWFLYYLTNCKAILGCQSSAVASVEMELDRQWPVN